MESALGLNRLSLQQTAVLLNAGPEDRRLVLEAAGTLKRRVYGDRIVVFAPLYIGNKCVNDCSYCGFRSSNPRAVRRTLSPDEIAGEVRQLSSTGQKRLILVFGEHPLYDPGFIASAVRLVYSTRQDHDRINRVNINAAPFDVDGFRTIKRAGIGTYQIFQETYDPQVYSRIHGRGPKSDYTYRLTAMDRAMEAGIDDVGLGVLLGHADWRFEVMALVRHTNHLEACYGVGPHTISFPRVRKASNLDLSGIDHVTDDDFRYLVAVLRLAVPYAGLILTAREPGQLRNGMIKYGVSQIDAGTRLEIGGYSGPAATQQIDREQFELSDTRTLEQTVAELVKAGQIPSFCTACYRKGRTGEYFMQFASGGHIKHYCTPNALLSFAEYLCDYTSGPLYEKGWELIRSELDRMPAGALRDNTAKKLREIPGGARDLFM